jgi:broad specificity phosphatase PhoE
MRLYIVRHAQTAWNVLERAQGHTDIELDETGIAQCACLADAFRSVPVSHVLSSDLVRSAECGRAVAAASGAGLVLDPRLRERAMGDWEGLDYREFNRRFREAAASNDPLMLSVRPPGGESLEDVWKRIEPIVAELRSSDEPSVVVTHGGTASLLLAQMLRGTLESAKSFRFANAGITELSRRPDGLLTLVRYNDSCHLEGQPAMSGNLDGISR